MAYETILTKLQATLKRQEAAAQATREHIEALRTLDKTPTKAK